MKDNFLYIPVVQLQKFLERFPELTSKELGEVFNDAITRLKNDQELLKTIPVVSEIKDGGSYGEAEQASKE